MQFIKSMQLLFQIGVVHAEKVGTVLNAHQKFREAPKIANDLPSLAAEVGMTSIRKE